MATDDKYDRQLRLWGPNGQKLLMNSEILLIKAAAVGTEVLKNLVLPGCGSFTILDDFIVDQNDLGSNFFTSSDNLSKPRAKVVTDLLCEMNPDVKGHSRVANFTNVLQTEPEYFSKFNLIIAANLPEGQLLPLADLCWKNSQPLLIVKSYGFIGSLRIQLRHHDIIESRTETDKFDLRISQPFPELVDYCEKIDFSSLSSIDHGHISYIVILYHAIKKWKNEHGGNVPGSFNEKQQFKEFIKGMSRDYNMELNFQEAVQESHRAYLKVKPSDDTQTLLNSVSNDLNKDSRHFEFLVRAQLLFQEQYGIGVLNGQIPDMTSSTEGFMKLQGLYKDQANKDFKNFSDILYKLLQTAGLPTNTISTEEILTFCKNSYHVLSVTTNPVCAEYEQKLKNPAESVINEILTDDLYVDPKQTPILWHLGLRAADQFYGLHARWPGDDINNKNLESDEKELFRILSTLARLEGVSEELIGSEVETENPDAMETENEAETENENVGPLVSLAHAKEITRYGGCELHGVSAVIGGVAAQEAVKALTHQYSPINNTYVYNGIASCGCTYQL